MPKKVGNCLNCGAPIFPKHKIVKTINKMPERMGKIVVKSVDTHYKCPKCGEILKKRDIR